PSRAAQQLLATLADALADDRREKLACCRVIARLLAADGALDETERSFLATTMERHGLSVADRERVLAPQGSVDDELAEIAPAARAELLRYLEAAAALDGRLAPEEAAILERVRSAT
ncbi:MAG TPA: hypothetical protein VFG69_19480, partial [Nannocystaceae bacterium]|nr:hypothetical protein [Nannocystaceae bacterium]